MAGISVLTLSEQIEFPKLKNPCCIALTNLLEHEAQVPPLLQAHKDRICNKHAAVHFLNFLKKYETNITMDHVLACALIDSRLKILNDRRLLGPGFNYKINFFNEDTKWDNRNSAKSPPMMEALQRQHELTVQWLQNLVSQELRDLKDGLLTEDDELEAGNPFFLIAQEFQNCFDVGNLLIIKNRGKRGDDKECQQDPWLRIAWYSHLILGLRKAPKVIKERMVNLLDFQDIYGQDENDVDVITVRECLAKADQFQQPLQHLVEEYVNHEDVNMSSDVEEDINHDEVIDIVDNEELMDNGHVDELNHEDVNMSSDVEEDINSDEVNTDSEHEVIDIVDNEELMDNGPVRLLADEYYDDLESEEEDDSQESEEEEDYQDSRSGKWRITRRV